MAFVTSEEVSFTNNRMRSKEALQAAEGAVQDAQTALASANGKNTNFYGESVPVVANLKKNDTWFQTNSSGLCVGIHEWDGTSWVKRKMDYQALSVNQLSALSADLGNVTAGNIAGVNLNLGSYNSVTGHYPFEADKNGKVYLSDLTVNNASTTPTNNFTPYFTINDGAFNGYGRIERTFDNQGVQKKAYYKMRTTNANGMFRILATSKEGTLSGGDSDFSNFGSRSLYVAERGISSSYGVFAGTSTIGNSRYIDFWPGENGYNTSNSQQVGMEIFSGAGMRIAGGTKSTIFEIISGGSLTIQATDGIEFFDDSGYYQLSDLYKNGSNKLYSSSLDTTAINLYLRPSEGSEVRVTSSGTIDSYERLRASGLFANFLEVNTGTHIYLRPSSSGVARVTAAGSTSTYRPIQASSFDVSSSYTYKQDITEMKRSALDIVDQLKIYEYRMIDDVQNGITDNWKIGLIAEYSSPVAIEDNMKIDTYKMQSMLWKATQELYTLIKGLEVSQGIQENTIKEQNELISALEARITALENK